MVNEVWLSVNSGVSWTQQTSAAQWPARWRHTSVVVGNSIITMGGENGGRKSIFLFQSLLYIVYCCDRETDRQR